MGDSRRAAAEWEEDEEYKRDMEKAKVKLESLTPQSYNNTVKKMDSLMNHHQHGLSNNFVGNSFQHQKMNELRALIQMLQP